MRASLLLIAALVAGCDAAGHEQDGWAGARALARAHGCGTCHEMPGMAAPDGVTGPPLLHMAEQAYVAGVAANTPEMLARFIHDPQAVDPRSAMPKLDLSQEDAETLAAFLYAVTSEAER